MTYGDGYVSFPVSVGVDCGVVGWGLGLEDGTECGGEAVHYG